MNKLVAAKIKRRINKLHKIMVETSNQDDVLCGNRMGLVLPDGRSAIAIIEELAKLVNSK